MTRYGQAFYGSDEIHEILGMQVGQWKGAGSQVWQSPSAITFTNPNALHKLPIGHWFYDSYAFKCAKKPSDEIARPLTDYSDDELQVEIDRRKAQDDEITILARELCAKQTPDIRSGIFLKGAFDETQTMKATKAAIIAGMELQKG